MGMEFGRAMDKKMNIDVGGARSSTGSSWDWGAPVLAIVANSARPDELLASHLGCRRAATLAARTRAWARYRGWLRAACGVGHPREAPRPYSLARQSRSGVAREGLRPRDGGACDRAGKAGRRRWCVVGGAATSLEFLISC